MSRTTDFGAPTEFGMHHFYVEIPASPRDAISIFEDFGFDGDEARRETVECRLSLDRGRWARVREDDRRDFDRRLKSKAQSTGSWTTGKVKLDRFLGRELCVLGWAAEHATSDECLVISQKWLALRPEERWWLYSKTASEAGLENQFERGWRKALYCALSDGTNIKLGPKKKTKTKEKKLNQKETVSLFDFIDKGDI